MKTKFSKLVSLALIMALVLSTMIFTGAGSVVLADAEQSSTNLIAGTTPTDFYRAPIGDPADRSSYQWKSFNVANVGDRFGYFYSWTDQKANIIDCVATATDSNTASGNAYWLDRSYVMIFDLGQYAALDSIAVNIGSNDPTAKMGADFSVYAAATRSDIFSATPATFTIPWGKSGGCDLNCMARFVAVVATKNDSINANYISFNNIELNGSYCENVLSGSLPIRFCSVNKDAYSFNWTTTKATKSGAATYNNHGYTETDGWGRRDGFAPYLSLLTDGDESEKLTIEPENRSSSYVLIAYELPEAGTLRGIEIISTDYDSNAEVYASTSKSDLFDSGNMVGSFTRDGSAYTSPNLINTDIDNAKFIGIYMRDTYQSGFCEIRAFAPESGLSDNLLAGLSPVSGYGVTKGTTTFTYHGVRTGDNANMFGYGTAPAASSNADFVSAVAKFTDGLTATGTATLYNEWKDGEDALITYKLTERALINNITLDSTSALKTTKVYLSNSFANLYNSESLAVTYTTNDSDTSVSIDLPVAKSALYVTFVFDVSKNGGQTLQEIKVRGNYLSDLTASAVAASGTLTNAANAYDEAKDFYNYLKRLGNGNGCMLGAEINVDEYSSITSRSNNDNYYEYLTQLYGTAPVVVSSHINQDKWDAERAKRYYDEGSVLMFSAGIDSPSVNGLSDLQKPGAVRYYDATYTPSASEEDFYDDVQDEVADSYQEQADFFESLEEAGVKAYIVRPFIEMNIKSVCSNTLYDARQNFKNVWQQMYNYFVVERELKGIIFAFAPCAISGSNKYDPMTYYPGDNYVDIIAPTIYSQTNDGVLPAIVDYAEMLATGKPFAFSEIGLIKSYDVTTRTDCMNMLNSIKTSYPTATFANLWYGNNFGLSAHSNPDTFIKNDYFITTAKFDEYKYGLACDFNRDGTVNIIDLVRLKKFMANDSQGVNILLADCDKNRSFGASDLTVVADILLGR